MTIERNDVATIVAPQDMNAFATRIERDLQVVGYHHCAVYEGELKCLWPLDDEQREAKIDQFAREHGLRLLFYQKGLCAIFDKKASRAPE